MENNILIDHYLDLCGLVCPVNFVKCCLTLETLSFNEVLKVDLDIGEAETSVMDGLQDKGYKVKILKRSLKKVTLLISSD